MRGARRSPCSPLPSLAKVDGGDPHELQPQRRRSHRLRGQDLRVGRARRPADLQQRKSPRRGFPKASRRCQPAAGSREVKLQAGKAPCPFPTHPECLERSHHQILSFPGPFFQLGKKGNQVTTGNGTEVLLFLFPGAKRIKYMHFVVSLLPLLFNYFYHGVPVPLSSGDPDARHLPLLPPPVWWLRFRREIILEMSFAAGGADGAGPAVPCPSGPVLVLCTFPKAGFNGGQVRLFQLGAVSGLDLLLMCCSQEESCN